MCFFRTKPKINVKEEYAKRHEEKELINLVVIGECINHIYLISTLYFYSLKKTVEKRMNE